LLVDSVRLLVFLCLPPLLLLTGSAGRGRARDRQQLPVERGPTLLLPLLTLLAFRRLLLLLLLCVLV